VRNIGSDMVAAHGQDIGVPNIPADVDRQVGRAAAQVHHGNTHFTFSLREHNLTRSQWVQHKL